MFGGRDFDLFRCSDATQGPMVVSEDLMRCLLLYSYSDFPSVVKELDFLFDYYGDDTVDHIQKKQFVSSEYMDIIWAYFDIEDAWTRQQYFNSKACYLKSLRDNLIMVNLYSHYEGLEPFQLLDNCFDVVATVKDLAETSPISWVQNAPVTKLHRHLSSDALRMLDRLPNSFGCLGYNFTKQAGSVCMRDSCGLSLYKTAEFDFTPDGIYISPNNIALFDIKRIEEHLRMPLQEKGSVSEVKNIIGQAKKGITPMQLSCLDPKQAIFDLFTSATKDKLYPVAGNKVGLNELVTLFNSLE